VLKLLSAVAEKKLLPKDLSAARWDTAAATLVTNGGSVSLGSVGEISKALSPLLGVGTGRLVFSAGVLGASMVAAMVSSLALA
jgi:hypothetical protein